MKKISELNQHGERKEWSVRYYSGKKLILEVTEASLCPAIAEKVNIEGNYYFVKDIVNYPEIVVIDIIMEILK